MRLSTQPRTGLIAVTDLGEQVADLGAGAATTTGSVGDTAGRMRLSTQPRTGLIAVPDLGEQ